MAHSYHHAVSSARKFGGIASDYQELHDWLDGSKLILADFRHRALRHHAEGCFAAEALFGVTITNSDGRRVPVRLLAEQHILEDLGRVPSFADWVRAIRPEPWMGRVGTRLDNIDMDGNENMADYFTQFSCILDVGTAENAAQAGLIRSELADELDRDGDSCLGFEMDVDRATGPGALWLHSGEYGEPEHVIAFVLRCADKLGLRGAWGFTWSFSCSKPRLDAFGGGAHILDLGKRATIADIDCNNFLVEQIAAAQCHAEGSDDSVPVNTPARL